jgi:hypothetical protein
MDIPICPLFRSTSFLNFVPTSNSLFVYLSIFIPQRTARNYLCFFGILNPEKAATVHCLPLYAVSFGFLWVVLVHASNP